MRLKLILLALLMTTVVGCASTETKYVTRVETVTVYKPVFTPPEDLQQLEDIQRPDLATNYLTKDDKERPGHVVKVTIEAMAQLRTYAEMLEDRINVYKQSLNKPGEELPEPVMTVETTESDKPFEDQ